MSDHDEAVSAYLDDATRNGVKVTKAQAEAIIEAYEETYDLAYPKAYEQQYAKKWNEVYKSCRAKGKRIRDASVIAAEASDEFAKEEAHEAAKEAADEASRKVEEIIL
jgi:hypothetical protein